MNIGAVIFAQNNNSVDYVKMAAYSAQRVKQYLNIPVSIVTNSRGWLNKLELASVFDKVIDIADNNELQNYRRMNDGTLSSRVVNWKNYDRSSIYELTPYDRTLVIDSDYIVSSDFLAASLQKDCDLQLYKDSFDLVSWRTNKEFERINPYSIEFYWATVFVFQKNPQTKTFFELVTYIKTHWSYFVTLYNLTSPLYRNDIAFSIAIHIMNGNKQGQFAELLPGKMCFTSDRDVLIDIKENAMKFLIEKEDYLGEYTAVKSNGVDVHVMNKDSLNRFIDGGSGV
jgi:hypothetical protein